MMPQSVSQDSSLRRSAAFILQTAFWFVCLAAIVVCLLLVSSDIQSFRYVGF